MNHIGKRLYGYCNGFFGRDSYEDKIIEAQGKDWIVCRYIDDSRLYPIFASFPDEWENKMNEFIEEWSIKR